jgi:uncharacterized membrane protein HdeD (DUF308 family)
VVFKAPPGFPAVLISARFSSEILTMGSAIRHQPADAITELASEVRSNSGWFLALGILQIIVGIWALCFSLSATIASVAVLGSILLIAGGAQVAAAFLARSWSGFFLFLLIGILYAITGALALTHPIAAAAGLTLLIGAALLVGGTFRIAVSLSERFPSWGWVLVNGMLTVLLGVLILIEWPVSGLWVLGLFVGIELIANGVMWSVLAAGIRGAMKPFVRG